MKYYKLTYSNNIKEVGRVPQSEECIIGDIQQDFIPWEGRININFKLPEPNLEKNAKQTSYINVVAIPSWFLVIDDDLLNLLKVFNVGNYQNWKIKTWYNKAQIIDKYNLFIINDTKQREYINFKKSEFYSKRLGDWDNSSIQKSVYVENYDNYISEKEALRKNKFLLHHSKVTFDFRDATEDMFRIINAPSNGYFVSEKLKNMIEEKGLSGMQFLELNELDNVEVL